MRIKKPIVSSPGELKVSEEARKHERIQTRFAHFSTSINEKNSFLKKGLFAFFLSCHYSLRFSSPRVCTFFSLFLGACNQLISCSNISNLSLCFLFSSFLACLHFFPVRLSKIGHTYFSLSKIYILWFA